MQIGRVLGEAWGLYKRFFWRFFATAFSTFAEESRVARPLASAAKAGRSLSQPSGS